MDPTRLSYGNVKPADVLQHLSGPCNDQLTGCDYANVADLSVPSQMYVNADTIPISGTLKLDPKGDFLIGEGSEFVGCITKTAPFGTQVSLSKSFSPSGWTIAYSPTYYPTSTL